MKILLAVFACCLMTSSAFARVIIIAERISENGESPPTEVIMTLDEDDNISFLYCLEEDGCRMIGQPHSVSDYQDAIPKIESYKSAHSTNDTLMGGAVGLLPFAMCMAKLNTCAHLLAKLGQKGSAIGATSISTLPLLGLAAGPILGKSIREEEVQAEYVEAQDVLEDATSKKRVVVFTDNIRELVGNLSLIEARIASEKERRQ